MLKRKVTGMIVAGNAVGAFLTYSYYRNIAPPHRHPQAAAVPFWYYDLFFLVGTALLIATFVGLMRRSSSPLYQVATGGREIDDFPPSEAADLQRGAFQFPAAAAGVSLVVWLLAGFLFGLLEPLITEKLHAVPAPPLGTCLRRFFEIAFIGGAVTCIFVYLATEFVWRPHLTRFVPAGELGSAREAFTLNVNTRLLIVFLAISLIPLPMMGIAALSKAGALHNADALTRNALLSSLRREIVFITLLSAATSIVLALFVSRSVSRPLHRLAGAMRAVKRGDLDARLDLVSNDEIGNVTEGFNQMARGLQETESIKESFGRYVSRQVRDEILAGRVPLDGEMKRVTLLFSDLRGFTPFVESTPPRQVVAIMNRYFSEMTAAVKEQGGLVLQYVGDEIEAVFGAPVTFDDHTDAAVRAALEMRRRLEALNTELQSQGHAPLEHGVGIHTGAVLAGNIGSPDRMSYALVGDTVNLASRIEGLTKRYGFDILMSQTTHSLLTGSYQTAEVGSVRVRGRSERTTIYRLVAAG